MEKSLYTSDYQAFLALLRTARTESGLTQIQLAERLQITQSMLSKIERGERRLDIGEIRVFCRAVGLTVGELVRRWEIGIGDR